LNQKTLETEMGILMNAPIFSSARPYTRWWWFSGPIDAAAIRHQLNWLAANGFGGVEIAWMYPQDNRQLGAPWLSAAWAELVRSAAEYATQLGLGCDFTLGSAWRSNSAARRTAPPLAW
jgi:hypothetical protein